MTENFTEFAERAPSYLMIVPKQSVWKKTFEIAGWVIVPVIKAGMEIYDLIGKAGLPEVSVLLAEEATGWERSGDLKFHIGGVKTGILFRRHPYRTAVYIQSSEYNPYLLREKIAELARVMILAGAKLFEISVDSTDTRELVVKATAPIIVQAKGTFRVLRRGATRITWSYTGAGGESTSLPDGLVWYDHEPEWQAVWDSAVYHGAQRHKIQISQDSSHQFSTDLLMKFKNAGFDLGGAFQIADTSWLSVDVSFGGN